MALRCELFSRDAGDYDCEKTFSGNVNMEKLVLHALHVDQWIDWIPPRAPISHDAGENDCGKTFSGNMYIGNVIPFAL